MGLFDSLKRLFGSNGATDASVEETAQGEPPTAQATALVDEAAQAGYDLDFSPASLAVLDSMVENFSEAERETLSRPIAAYLGEVFVRSYDGEWILIEEVGWVVDLSAATAHDEEEIFAIPQATWAAMEGNETFASVHDQTVAGLAVDAEMLSDGPPQAGPGGNPVDEATRQAYREKAEEFVEAWPGYNLDYSPASLAEVDDLIAEHYDRTPDEVDRADRLSEGPAVGVPEGVSLTVGTGGATTQIAAYVGEVFSREYDAEWHDGPFDSLVIETPAQAIEFEPEHMVNVAYDGWISFEKLHETLVTEHGLAVDD